MNAYLLLRDLRNDPIATSTSTNKKTLSSPVLAFLMIFHGDLFCLKKLMIKELFFFDCNNLINTLTETSFCHFLLPFAFTVLV
jgi:hypothetical protein